MMADYMYKKKKRSNSSLLESMNAKRDAKFWLTIKIVLMLTLVLFLLTVISKG